MEDYKKEYFTLFNAVSDAIALLQEAQQKAEELYLARDEDERPVEDEESP